MGATAHIGAVEAARTAAGQAATNARQAEYARIVQSFAVFSVPADIRTEILEALHSSAWDWYRDCDGCTCVSEIYWPTKYFPPCLRHDFDCATGHNGTAASRRFYRIQRAYGVNRVQAGARAMGVTVAWYAWLKWR
jgi:hypothetical protein